MRRAILIATLLSALIPTAGHIRADDGQRLLSVDHYVKVTSTVPALAGQAAQIYVRERVLTGVALRGAAAPDKVALFVHGAGTPAGVASDAPIAELRRMAYLAEAGFDVFAMDPTG